MADNSSSNLEIKIVVDANDLKKIDTAIAEAAKAFANFEKTGKALTGAIDKTTTSLTNLVSASDKTSDALKNTSKDFHDLANSAIQSERKLAEAEQKLKDMKDAAHAAGAGIKKSGDEGGASAPKLGLMAAALKKIKDITNGMPQKMEQLGASFKQSALVQSLGAAAVGAAIKKSLDAFSEKQQAVSKLQATLRATGYASGQTAKGLSEMAEGMEQVTNFSAEDIMGGQATLLRFKSIGSDVFPTATKAMVDMAQAMGTDVSSAAQQLGKALQNPMEATGTLKKAGIDLTVAQEELIKKLMKTGDIAGAQGVILKEVANTVGGSAEAMASPWEKVSNLLGKFAEAIGQTLMPVANDLITNILTPLVKIIEDNSAAFTAIVGVLTTVVLALTGPVGIAAAVGIVAALFYRFRKTIYDVFLALNDMMWSWAESFMEVVTKVSSYLNLKVGQDTLASIKSMRAKIKAEREGIQSEWDAEEKAKKAKEKKAEEEAAKGGKSGKNKAKKNAVTEGNAEEIADQKAKVKKYKEMYGEDYDNYKDFIKEKEKFDQKQKARDLKTQLQSDRRIYKAAMSAKEDEVEFAINAEQRKIAEEKQQKQSIYDFEHNIGDARMEYAQNFFGNLSALQQSNSKELFEVGKVAAIANATVSTAEGVTKTLSAYPAPFNFALAAAVAAAGAVQIATISNQQPAFETGGMYSVNSGIRGTDSITGVYTPGELVVPTKSFDEVVTSVADSRLNKGKNQGPQVVNQHNYHITIQADSTTDGKKLGKEVQKVIDKNEKRKRQENKMRTV